VTHTVARALPYAAVALAAASWGLWALIIRHTEAIAPMPAALESSIVMGVITIVSGVTSVRDRASEGRTWKAWACVGWLGAGDLLNVLLFFAAYKLTIAVAVLTHYMTPIFVAVTAPFVLREPMTARTGFAVAVSVAGLVTMLVPSVGAAGAAKVWASAALGTASAVFYASNVLVNKFIVRSFSTSQAMFWHGVVATPLGAILVPPAAWATIDAHAVTFLAIAAIGPGALAGLAFVWGLRRMPAAHASTLTLLEPLVSVLLAAWALGERVAAPAVLGGALILAGAVTVMMQAQAPAGTAGSPGRQGAKIGF
jgi:drug/metabolite transporter (DMT)-like permease